ncbi:hypothetical protein F5J12DRAFT_973834 [Pisolithus orientalis]|uniref:uncharacterized protein n=1 Tax=Pisolithus orientalis TaxID=936130 RepID=UPI002224595F|nr:uncharacterized protein F5J12DRAFT_973834 [Pisolithus orientalis]KAI5986087.1 hypothetical protein F5J12DRAFT_973834 [Pisolithus orientalis]
MEVRQVIQGTAKVKPVRLRQVPASRDPGQEIGPPVVMETRQAIQVAAKAKSVRPRQGPVSLQGKPGNIVIQPCGEAEVADMEVNTHQTTNFCPFFDKWSYYHCQLQYKPSIPGSVIFNIFNQGKMPVPTHCMDEEELEDQPAFSVKVVGHEKFKVVMSMANDIESNNEFNQLIFAEVQTSSKHKYSDHDNADYVTSSKVEDFDDEYFDIEDHNLKSYEELIQSLRIIILTIAPDFEDLNDICPGMAVFNIVFNFGSTAITLITHFLVSDPEIGMLSLTQAQELCSKLLEGFAFLYSDQDSHKPENIFQSYFVLYLLGHTHLWPCGDSPDVPKLKIRELKNTGIKGTLALTCAMLHCTLPLLKTGELQIDTKHTSFRKAAIKIPLKVNKVTRRELSAVSAFSEQNCGPCTRQYAIATTKHDNAVLQNIIMGATMLIPYSIDCMLEGGSFQCGEDDINDLIATLCLCSFNVSAPHCFIMNASCFIAKICDTVWNHFEIVTSVSFMATTAAWFSARLQKSEGEEDDASLRRWEEYAKDHETSINYESFLGPVSNEAEAESLKDGGENLACHGRLLWE